MSDPTTDKYKIGDRVLLKIQAGRAGKIIDFAGKFGAKGERIYRVLIRTKPRPGYVDVLEAHLDPAPAKSGS